MVKSTSKYEEVFAAWECAFPESGIIYLSGPISTGLRAVEAVAKESGETKGIRAENCDILRKTAQHLRSELRDVVIEPASLEIAGWTQSDYHELWRSLIRRYARKVVFMPGWEYSYGCALEFAEAMHKGIQAETLAGERLTIASGLDALDSAIQKLRTFEGPPVAKELAGKIEQVVGQFPQPHSVAIASTDGLRKDASLNRLAERGMNVAQFVSFEPVGGNPVQTFSRIAARIPNEAFASPEEALKCLLASSAEASINVRSYEPHNPQSREFVYGLKTVADALQALERLSAQGLHTIANETIDVGDGGVSGVLMGDIIEFSPDDTPRCVEKPGTVSLPRNLGIQLLKTVYGIPFDLQAPMASRTEFSIHPRPRGWMQKNIITWEYSDIQYAHEQANIRWPNKFSRMIGDKAFGLLIADLIGLPVPQTTVISRRIAPFTFGRLTGSGEHWIRTAPKEQMPGKFSTYRGWVDPFALLYREDPEGAHLAAVLSQVGVKPIYSGALITTADDRPLIEGRAGSGDVFMLGEASPEEIPESVRSDVRDLYMQARTVLGAVRFEWVHDGSSAWIVQFHRGATMSTAERLTPGEAASWILFDAKEGLETLRALIAQLAPDSGLIIKGNVGVTSHIADVIRKAAIPAKMVE